ncbi:hypothetical protein, partial [Serratia marcescens]|uniref:hypothetical protein n=1 Tax=Serratia marcescens TaxID=615 RepID=UPI0032097344
VWAVMAFAEMGDIERAWQLMALINPINHSLDSAAARRRYFLASSSPSTSPTVAPMPTLCQGLSRT